VGDVRLLLLRRRILPQPPNALPEATRGQGVLRARERLAYLRRCSGATVHEVLPGVLGDGTWCVIGQDLCATKRDVDGGVAEKSG
jgi:hypothetical protein